MGHRGATQPVRLDADAARLVATTLQALATPSRLLILSRLREGPSPVQDLADSVGMAQPAVSHQLRLLRHLGLVVGDRDGRHVVYRLHDDHVATLVGQVIDQAVHHAEHVRLGMVDGA